MTTVPLTISPPASDERNLTGDETTKWQWARSRTRSSWTDIAMATLSSYTPVKDDVGSYLRVTATYLDRRSENPEDVKEAEATNSQRWCSPRTT